jgi:hypothetical protein
MYASSEIITVLYIRNADNLLCLPFGVMVVPFLIWDYRHDHARIENTLMLGNK